MCFCFEILLISIASIVPSRCSTTMCVCVTAMILFTSTGFPSMYSVSFVFISLMCGFSCVFSHLFLLHSMYAIIVPKMIMNTSGVSVLNTFSVSVMYLVSAIVMVVVFESICEASDDPIESIVSMTDLIMELAMSKTTTRTIARTTSVGPEKKLLSGSGVHGHPLRLLHSDLSLSNYTASNKLSGNLSSSRTC